ncbi:MAG: C40 family peptidase [Oscillospiraceae bacterium]|nr:C40 family peptidase [Oscillospiraceae bacterium]
MKKYSCLILLGSAALSAPAMTVSAAAEDSASGWQTVDGDRYYYTEDGSAAEGETVIGGQTYLFAPNGVQQLGWQTVDGKRLYFNPADGEPVFGVIRWRGGIYYVTPENGKSVNERLTLEDGIHQTGSDGMMLTGWQDTGNGRCFFDENGCLLTGKNVLDGELFDLGEDGILRTGLTEYDGRLFYRNADGSCLTGWYTDESTGNTYYFGEDGGAVSGQQTIDGKDYFFDESRIMQRGAVTVGEAVYYYDENGAGISGIRLENGKPRYYRHDHTVMTGTAADGIRSDGDDRMAFAADGSLAFCYELQGDKLTYTEADGTRHETALSQKTNLGLAYYAIRKLGCAYWYGCYGQIADEQVYQDFSNYYPQYYSAWNDYETQYGGQVFDCVGLIKSYLWSADIDSLPVVNESQIVSSTGMFEAADAAKRGTIGNCPWTVGTLVFRSDSWSTRNYGIHHVGIYIGNGMVVEAKGHEYGVILTTNTDFWTHWAQCPWTENTLTGTLTAVNDKAYYVYNDGAVRHGTSADGIVAFGDDFVCFNDDGSVRFGFERSGDRLRYMNSCGDVIEEAYSEKTNLGLAYYAISKLGCSYWYDGHGEIGTQALLDKLRPQFYDYYKSWNNYDTQFGGQVFDCSGLITAYLASDDLNTIPNVTPEINLSSTNYYETASLRDTIAYCPWTIGTLVFRSDSWSTRNYGIHHVGIYIGNGMVVEAKGHEYGVILSTDLSTWTHWAQCEYTKPVSGPQIRIDGTSLSVSDNFGAPLFSYTTEGSTLHYTDSEGNEQTADMTKKTQLGLAYYVLHKVGLPYWQGAYGQIASKELWDLLSQYAYNNYTRFTDYPSQYGKQVFDCIGLVKSYFWCDTVDSLPVVNWDQAINESQMYDACPTHGTIESCPWEIGTLVFHADPSSTRPNKIHHIGVYIGNGLVVEAKGHICGVICAVTRDRWTHWAKCVWTET